MGFSAINLVVPYSTLLGLTTCSVLIPMTNFTPLAMLLSIRSLRADDIGLCSFKRVVFTIGHML